MTDNTIAAPLAAALAAKDVAVLTALTADLPTETRGALLALPSLFGGREVLAEAIEAGGSSLRDHRQASGELGYFQHSFRVYDRESAPCPRPACPGTIRRIVQSERSSFYCPACQR